MKNAIHILKMSLDNLKSEVTRKTEELKEAEQNLASVKEECEVINERILDVERAIEKLNQKDSNAASKNKKTK